MSLGDKIKELREGMGYTQGELAAYAAVSQGYLSQLENGDVRNPSAAVLLRLAQAVQVEPDDLFESAGYPTTRTLRQLYREFEASVDPDLLRYLGRLTRDRQRRLLFLLESMENLVGVNAKAEVPQQEVPQQEKLEGVDDAVSREDVPFSRLQR